MRAVFTGSGRCCFISTLSSLAMAEAATAALRRHQRDQPEARRTPISLAHEVVHFAPLTGSDRGDIGRATIRRELGGDNGLLRRRPPSSAFFTLVDGGDLRSEVGSIQGGGVCHGVGGEEG
uniref:Secreted protein n=1 Tax=Triticum urartu TaxID=4572 RepID=A0A8R7P960_TRIUA